MKVRESLQRRLSGTSAAVETTKKNIGKITENSAIARRHWTAKVSVERISKEKFT